MKKILSFLIVLALAMPAIGAFGASDAEILFDMTFDGEPYFSQDYFTEKNAPDYSDGVMHLEGDTEQGLWEKSLSADIPTSYILSFDGDISQALGTAQTNAFYIKLVSTVSPDFRRLWLYFNEDGSIYSVGSGTWGAVYTPTEGVAAYEGVHNYLFAVTIGTAKLYIDGEFKVEFPLSRNETQKGQLRIGKGKGDAASYATVDNFRLIKTSTPQKTTLCSYTQDSQNLSEIPQSGDVDVSLYMYDLDAEESSEYLFAAALYDADKVCRAKDFEMIEQSGMLTLTQTAPAAAAQAFLWDVSSSRAIPVDSFSPITGSAAASGDCGSYSTDIAIAAPDGTPVSIIIADNAEVLVTENAYYIAQSEVKSGKISVAAGFDKDFPSGNYAVFYDCKELDAMGKKTFSYVNPNDADAVIGQLNAASDAAALQSVAEGQRETLDITFASYYESVDKDALYTALLAARSEDFTYETFAKAFGEVYSFYMLKAASSAAELDELASYYGEFLWLDDTYDTYSEKVKEAVLKNAKKASSRIELEASMPQIIMMAQISGAERWGVLKTLVCETYSDAFSFKTSTYNKLKNKDAVYKAMMSYDLNSVSEVEKAFSKCVSAQYNKEHPSSSGGGGGGGSSSKGTAGVVLTPTSDAAVTEVLKTPEKKNAFPDVSKDDWAYEAVEALKAKGVIGGDENGAFNPKSNVSRAEFAKMIVLALNLEGSDIEMPFEDVEDNSWCFKYVQTLYSLKIASGKSESEFDPGGFITRQDAALIIYRALSDVKSAKGAAPTDIEQVSPYAQAAVEALFGAKIISGDENQNFNPQRNITRQETAQLLYNLAGGDAK